ncbi:N-acetyl-alpha-D-glucosaminyl L-malate synthase [subsurface metagenome]
MKIAILVPLFPPKWLGGTEIATYNIAKNLVTRGHEVRVITSLDESLSKETIEDGFHIHRISQQKLRFIGVISLWVKIFWLLKKINPDIVHAQSIGMGMPAFLAKKLLRKPYVVWGRGSEVYLPWLYKKPVSKLVLKSATAVIALTEDMKGEIQKICNREVSVIPNGIDLDRFQDLNPRTIREGLKVNSDERLILFVGGLKPTKGLEYLIQAMSSISQSEMKMKLLLVGQGEERDRLEQLAKNLGLSSYVKFVGEVPYKEVPEYMAASDVFVLPSLSEGFPNVILEAMASGMPIVATRVGGLAEIIKDGDNGFLVEPGNPQQLAEKVLLILKDKELRERISRNNKEAAKEYSWEGIVDRLEKVYSDCFNAKTGSN